MKYRNINIIYIILYKYQIDDFRLETLIVQLLVMLVYNCIDRILFSIIYIICRKIVLNPVILDIFRCT